MTDKRSLLDIVVRSVVVVVFQIVSRCHCCMKGHEGELVEKDDDGGS